MSTKKIPLLSDQIDMLEGGALDRDIGAALQEVVQGVISTRLMGSIKVEIKVKPEGIDQVLVETKVEAKPPQLPRAKTIMFVDRDFTLTDVDPAQMELEMADQPDVNRKPRVIIDNDDKERKA